MKWLRTFSIVEIFCQCLKKLVENDQGILKSVLDIKFLLNPNFVATKIFLDLIQTVEKLKNHFLLGQKVKGY